MSQATTTQGTILTYNAITVGEVTELNPSGQSADLIDVTPITSTSNYKEFIPGFIDGGDISVTMNLISGDAGQLAIKADFGTNIARTVTIAFKSGSTFTFNAIVQKCNSIPPAKVGDPARFSVTLKVTGAITETTSTSAGLTALAASAGTFNPVFATGTTEYILTVPNSTASITLTPTATGTITVTSNGATQTVTSTQASTAITTGVGITPITIAVAEANKAPKIYTIRVSRVS